MWLSTRLATGAAHSSATEATNRRTQLALKILTYLVLGLWAIMVLYPMAWAVMSAFKTDQEILFSPWTLPSTWHWENFARAWTKAHIGDYILNTIVVIVPSLSLTLLLSSMVSYVLARYEFRFKRIINYLLLAGMVFPLFLALVPLYFIMQGLQLRDTFQGLILVYVAFSFPFTVFYLRSFFVTLPGELAEAAIIDGASHYQIFFRVMLPLAKPGLITVAIFNFIGQWNQYILPSFLMDNSGLAEGQTRYVLSQGLYFLQTQQRYANDWSGMFAALTIVMIPTLTIYVIFHDRVEKGLTVGALKG